MENQKQKQSRKSRRLSLEEYLDFLQSGKKLNLNVNHLNQIVKMHGYRKLYKLPKQGVVDAVNTLDLIDPSRSTLKEIISSHAYISFEDLIRDLNDLNWQECYVTSLQTINGCNQNSLAPDLSHLDPKANMKSLESEVYSDSYSVDGASSCSASEIGDLANKLKSKRKRTTAEKDDARSLLSARV